MKKLIFLILTSFLIFSCTSQNNNQKNISWTWESENFSCSENSKLKKSKNSYLYWSFKNKNDWKCYYLWYFKNWNFFVVSEDSKVDWWWERWAWEKGNLLYKDIFDNNYQKFLEDFKLQWLQSDPILHLFYTNTILNFGKTLKENNIYLPENPILVNNVDLEDLQKNYEDLIEEYQEKQTGKNINRINLKDLYNILREKQK